MDAEEWIKEIENEDRERKRDNADPQTFSSKDVIDILKDVIKTKAKSLANARPQ